MSHFADRLSEVQRRRGTALCVGLDPRWESLPDEIRNSHNGDSIFSIADAFEAVVIEDHVPAGDANVAGDLRFGLGVGVLDEDCDEGEQNCCDFDVGLGWLRF